MLHVRLPHLMDATLVEIEDSPASLAAHEWLCALAPTMVPRKLGSLPLHSPFLSFFNIVNCGLSFCRSKCIGCELPDDFVGPRQLRPTTPYILSSLTTLSASCIPSLTLCHPFSQSHSPRIWRDFGQRKVLAASAPLGQLFCSVDPGAHEAQAHSIPSVHFLL